jgi:hypothetical protein
MGTLGSKWAGCLYMGFLHPRIPVNIYVLAGRFQGAEGLFSAYPTIALQDAGAEGWILQDT